MSFSGAYEDDMGRFRNLSEADIDRIMAGRVPADGDEFSELAAGLAALKAVESRGTDQIATRHLAEIAEASGVVVRTPSLEAEVVRGATTRWRKALQLTRSFVAKLGIATAALALSTAGLAAAGVDLPGTAAEKAFDKVGIHLPNQGGDDATHGKSAAERVHAAQDAASEKGCEFGQGVSEAASANNNGKSTKEKDPCEDRNAEGTDDDTGTLEDDHGQAGDDHGQAGDDHGQAGDDHGQAGDDHGQAGDDHGQAGDNEDETSADL
ncbi:MAG: hypothetical protein JJE05_13290 [Actinobacteria bacterium]|nr:hypothetical protein [Actinomycetota bacterium]